MSSIDQNKRALARSRGRALLLSLLWCSLLALLLNSFVPISRAQSSSNVPADALPRYNQVAGIATHNSYWMNRNDNVDFGASGTQELISDQLLHEHIRAAEIDIHAEGSPDHEWKVYHTSDSENFSCSPLSDCLKMFRLFQYQVPQHEAFNIVIELKDVSPVTAYFTHGTVNPNFDATHTIQDLDNIIRNTLGSALYTPKDFLSRCPGVTVLTDCARSQGWPTIDQLRGKFIVNIIGNWGTAGLDWANYATTDTVNRAAFPMFSLLDTTTDTSHGVDVGNGAVIRDWSTSAVEPVFVPADEHRAAFNQSIFWQFEPFSNNQALAALKTFLGNNGVVRGGDSFTVSDQLARFALGIQMVQTDYPWAAIDSGHPLGIPVDPSQRYYTFAAINNFPFPGPNIIEPGNRFYFSTPDDGRVLDYKLIQRFNNTVWMDTTVSTTRRGNPWNHCDNSSLSNCEVTNFPRKARDLAVGPSEGCIRTETDDRQDWMEICRQKNYVPGCCSSLTFQEKVSVFIRASHQGQVTLNKEFEASRFHTCDDPAGLSPVCVGSMLAMRVQFRGTLTTVLVFSANRPDSQGNPDWRLIDTENFTDGPFFSKIGLAASRDVLFTGTHASYDVNAPASCGSTVDFTSMSSETLGGNGNNTLVDLSSGPPTQAGPCPTVVFAPTGTR